MSHDVDAPAAPARSSRARRLAWGAGLVAAALLAGYLAWARDALDRRLAQRTAELGRLKEEVAGQQELLRLFASPDTRVVALRGLGPSPSARGRIWWNPEAGGFLVAGGLPVAPPGKTYQLWAVAGDTPFSAAVFEVGRKGSAALRVKPLPRAGKVEAFAVTLEPAGGLPQPSGAAYLTALHSMRWK